MVNNQIFWAAYLGYVWGVLGYGDCYLYTVCPGTVTVFNLPIINIIRFPRHFLSLLTSPLLPHQFWPLLNNNSLSLSLVMFGHGIWNHLSWLSQAGH